MIIIIVCNNSMCLIIVCIYINVVIIYKTYSILNMICIRAKGTIDRKSILVHQNMAGEFAMKVFSFLITNSDFSFVDILETRLSIFFSKNIVPTVKSEFFCNVKKILGENDCRTEN